jgi:hypothetical protein
MIIRRIVFGEPKPGEAEFAKAISALDESVSYCNRIGPLLHDRVTDLPFTIPELALNYQHPTPLSFVSQAPSPPNDTFGTFAEHHCPLYLAGAIAAKVPALHIECARLCNAIYAYPGDPPEVWDARQDTAGVAWGIKIEGTQAFVVFRGSQTFLDWLRDLIGVAPLRHSVYDKLGMMWDGFVLGMPETWAAIWAILAPMSVNGIITELVITGHSLGAARAGVASAYALQSVAALKT